MSVLKRRKDKRNVSHSKLSTNSTKSSSTFSSLFILIDFGPWNKTLMVYPCRTRVFNWARSLRVQNTLDLNGPELNQIRDTLTSFTSIRYKSTKVLNTVLLRTTFKVYIIKNHKNLNNYKYLISCLDSSL